MSAEYAPIIPITEPRKSDEIAKRLLDRRVTLRADLEYIQGELEAIDAQLIDLLDGATGTHDVAGVKVEIREYSRTDLKWVEEQYPAAQYPQLYKTTTAVDGDAVKREFAPTVLAAHRVTGKKSVVVK